jgi:hypothetical protein
MAIRAACGVMKIQWTRSGGSRMGEWERSWKYNGIYSQPLNLGLFEKSGEPHFYVHVGKSCWETAFHVKRPSTVRSVKKG